MYKYLAYSKPGETNVFFVTLNLDSPEFAEGMSDSEKIDFYMDKYLPSQVPRNTVKQMDFVALPKKEDIPFGRALRLNGGIFSTDMPTARAVHQERIEAIKDREMKILGADIVIGQALGNDITGLQAQIQGIQTAIDNVGPNIAAAGTPVMLKAVWPVGLPTE